MLRTSTLKTSHADISVTETSGKGLPILFIHGNSSCKEVFANQLESSMGEAYRMIAFDLPGHGASSDAYNPRETYSMPGYAGVTMEVLNALGVTRAAVFGWSLGGHVALELLPRFRGLVGVMLTATAPVHATPESLTGSYRPHPMLPLIGKGDLTDEEAELFSETVYGDAATPILRAALRRTDGQARTMLFETVFDGRTADQRALAETTKSPIALVNGADDPIIDTDYIGSLTYASLWEKHCFALRGVGHAAFLTNPDVFNPIFERFLADMAALAGRHPKHASKAEAAA